MFQLRLSSNTTILKNFILS